MSEQGKPDPKSKPAEIIGGRQGRNDDLSQKGNGRSGRPDYDGTSNQSSRRQLGNPIDIGAAPIDVRAGSLGNQVRREDKARPNYRNGYYQYDSGWNDNNFCYPYYNFNWNNNCVISPWYYYSNLPGYLNCGRTTIITVGFCNWGIGDSYSWRERNNSNWGNWDRDDRRSDLDEAIDDLVIAFEDQDRRALDRIIPTRGRINIYVDGTYCYSLDPDDFYDLMSDNIYGTRTTSYDVLSVRRYNDEAQVATRHSFRDAWGRRSTVYHHYRFVRGRSGYTISDFLTGNRRTGF